MKPGIYRDMSLADYLAIPACSNSQLTDMLQSPAHCKYRMEHTEPPTPAQILGSAADMAILQPILFENHYRVAKRCQQVTQKQIQCSKLGSAFSLATGIWYCTQHLSLAADDQIHSLDPRTIISPEDYATCQNMKESVMSHPAALVMIDQASEKQMTVVWKDYETDLLCKIRLDAYCPELDSEADLKTTFDASPQAFEREIYRWGYHRQRYFYSMGMAAIGKPVEHSNIIAVEKEPPYAVAVYRLRPEALDLAHIEVRDLMEQYRRCVDTNKWPSYPSEVIEIGLPDYARKQIERRSHAA